MEHRFPDEGELKKPSKGKKLLYALVIALLVGVVLFGLSALAARTPYGYYNGFPLKYTSPISNCKNLNPYNGCGFSYSIPIIVADYLFWVAASFAVILVVLKLTGFIK